MDEQELKCILNTDEQVKKHFTGDIYCVDTLPLHLEKGYFYITNTRKSNHDFESEAGHWVTILFYQDGSLFFCNSFGTFPSPQFWLPLLMSNNTGLTYQPYQLQNYSATSCGMHVLLFSTFFSYDFKPPDILKYVYQIDNKNTSVSNMDYDQIARCFLDRFYGEQRGLHFEP